MPWDSEVNCQDVQPREFPNQGETKLNWNKEFLFKQLESRIGAREVHSESRWSMGSALWLLQLTSRNF